jgi:hypothetical protein
MDAMLAKVGAGSAHLAEPGVGAGCTPEDRLPCDAAQPTDHARPEHHNRQGVTTWTTAIPFTGTPTPRVAAHR